MTPFEPSRSWQDQQHQRILRNDPIAFAQLCELALSHLVLFLRTQFSNVEFHVHEMTAIDCLLNYQARPGQYDPGKLSLFAYLRMAARDDMLNAIDRQNRYERRLFSLDEPTIQAELEEDATLSPEFELEQWLQQYTEHSRQEILQAVQAELNSVDRQLLLLMLDGVRETEPYAEVMGIAHLDIAEQRREAKQAKDRLAKKLRRLGARLNRSS
jgi:DNA-directed RNA polymerase specialized sigma24 family protein